MGQTAAPWSLPYPELSEPADVPADIKQLCDRLNIVLPTLQQIVEKGAPSGYASLDATGKVPAAQLPATAGGGSVIQKTTQKVISNSAVATDLLNGEGIIPAGSMSTKGAIKFRLVGSLLNNSGSNASLTLSLRLGATVLWDAPTDQFATNASAHAFYMDGVILALNSLTAQRGGGHVVIADRSGVNTGVGHVADPGAGTNRMAFGSFETIQSALNMGAQQTLSVFATLSAANANLTMTLDAARIEVS